MSMSAPLHESEQRFPPDYGRRWWGCSTSEFGGSLSAGSYVSPKGHYPPAMRLYLPDSWRNDEGRLDKAGVPEEARRRLSQPQIALELLDRVRDEGLPGQIVVADAGYGV
jgi:SRSO17 transposase